MIIELVIKILKINLKLQKIELNIIQFYQSKYIFIMMMGSLVNDLQSTRVKSPMSVCGNHAAYLVRSGQKRYCFKRKSKLRGKPP
jgi:hypothetical protein